MRQSLVRALPVVDNGRAKRHGRDVELGVMSAPPLRSTARWWRCWLSATLLLALAGCTPQPVIYGTDVTMHAGGTHGQRQGGSPALNFHARGVNP
jgi:hypothetical protein